MNIYKIAKPNDVKQYLKRIGVQGGGVSIISKKMDLYYFVIKDISAPAANILKQDALSIGAELAVPEGVITCSKSSYDCLLIANQKQIEILSQKEKAQPFGLREFAAKLAEFLPQKRFPTQIMGVINANSDSFYSGSRFVAEDAIAQIEKMIADGAEIIDIGAVSSRPGSEPVDEDIELERVRHICDMISNRKLYKKVEFSIDSYTPSVVEYALKSGFKIINDITGADNQQIVSLAIKYDAKLCIMHMQGTPQTMQHNPEYKDVILEVDDFFRERIKKCEEAGLSRDRIILDVGIGFGKKLEHNIELIKNLSNFRKFGCQILVGASRKSMIDSISPAPVEDRLPGTIAIHLKSLENGANIIRCHDVAEHKQAVEVWESLH